MKSKLRKNSHPNQKVFSNVCFKLPWLTMNYMYTRSLGPHEDRLQGQLQQHQVYFEQCDYGGNHGIEHDCLNLS